MQNSTTKQKRHAFWSIILTGLVIITCLASTIASSSSYSSAQNNPIIHSFKQSHSFVQSSGHSIDTHLQSLYSKAFKSDNQTQITSSNEACSLSGQLLSYTSPKLDWLAAYIIISVMVYYIAQVSILGNRGFLQNTNVPKQRLHVTYCTFQE